MVIKKICEMNEKEQHMFYQLATEYIPDSDYDMVRRREADYPGAYMGAFIENVLVGVLYGWPRRIDDAEDKSLCIGGLAVDERYQRRGVGTCLVKEAAQAAGVYGCNAVSAGSAGGYVEEFYLASGFYPKEYKAWNNGIYVEKIFSDISDYRNYNRINPDGFVVMEIKLEAE